MATLKHTVVVERRKAPEEPHSSLFCSWVIYEMCFSVLSFPQVTVQRGSTKTDVYVELMEIDD